MGVAVSASQSVGGSMEGSFLGKQKAPATVITRAMEWVVMMVLATGLVIGAEDWVFYRDGFAPCPVRPTNE